MIYLYCSESLLHQGAFLHELLRKEVPCRLLQLVQSVDRLRQVLTSPGVEGQGNLVVFLAGASQELRLLQPLADLLLERDLVLIVPDESEDVIALAHAMCPRYLCCVDEDFNHVVQVIKKIRESGRIAGEKIEISQ